MLIAVRTAEQIHSYGAWPTSTSAGTPSARAYHGECFPPGVRPPTPGAPCADAPLVDPRAALARGVRRVGPARCPFSNSSFVAKISNTGDAAQSAGYFTCKSAATGGSAYFAYPLNEASGTTVADVSGNNRPGKYSTAGVTYGATGPCPRDSGKAVTLNGSSGYITGPATAITGPQTFSIEIWFKTTTVGGKLIGFGSSATGSSGSYDRHLYLTDGGILVFGVYPNAVKIVQSSAKYTDGTWHDAIATLAPANDPNPGIRLYVDGALVASDSTVVTAQTFSGYWRIGYDNINSWTSQPTNFYYTGTLADASVYTTALIPDAVAAHYRAGR